MNAAQIEKLLEKYFLAETTQAEEHALHAFFADAELPRQLKPLKAQFDHIRQGRTIECADHGFERKLLHRIKMREQQNSRRKIRTLLLPAIGAAAVLLISVNLLFNAKPAAVEDSFNDPAQAYQEVQKALFYVADKFNLGLKPAQKAGKDLQEGVDYAGKISRLHEVQTYFGKE